MKTGTHQRQVALGALVAAGIYFLQLWLFSGFTVDDSFITFRFVKQLNGGNGLVYNIGDVVEGYSNLLWILILAPLDRFGWELAIAAKLVGATFGLLALAITWNATRRLAHAWITPVLLASTPAFAAWAISGLETPLFTFLLLFATITFLWEEENNRGWTSGLLFALLALTRPEGLMFGMVAFLYRSLVLFKSRQRPAKRDYLRLASWLLPVALYFLWRAQYYGYWLPNTVYAKSMGFPARAAMEGIYYIYGGIVALGGWFVLAIPFVGLLMKWRFPSESVLLLAMILAQLALVLISGGDWMPLWRFWVHILPLIYLLIHRGLIAIAVPWPKPGIVLPLLIVGQCAYLLTGALEIRFVQGIGAGSLLEPPGSQITYLMQHVEPKGTIAVVDAGRIAYELPLSVRIVDMVGLTDGHIAHKPAQFPGGLWGRGDAFGKWDVEYVLAQKPQYIQTNVINVQNGQYETNFTGTTLLLIDPSFGAVYAPVGLPGTAGIFVYQGSDEYDRP